MIQVKQRKSHTFGVYPPAFAQIAAAEQAVRAEIAAIEVPAALPAAIATEESVQTLIHDMKRQLELGNLEQAKRTLQKMSVKLLGQ